MARTAFHPSSFYSPVIRHSSRAWKQINLEQETMCSSRIALHCAALTQSIIIEFVRLRVDLPSSRRVTQVTVSDSGRVDYSSYITTVVNTTVNSTADLPTISQTNYYYRFTPFVFSFFFILPLVVIFSPPPSSSLLWIYYVRVWTALLLCNCIFCVWKFKRKKERKK